MLGCSEGLASSVGPGCLSSLLAQCVHGSDYEIGSSRGSDVGAVGKMIGKNTNILGQLANIGSSKLEANRCQYLTRW